ncbi:hypothetical protein [Helicobacter sp. MIT 14-3879]|uniref:hypothetical protein n=1 Tax=Helicobacter sp. MIT 14-3879 TaxID=2040649 RepID=UPI000E1FAE37|nr:hypothetical protein [Helicobacter sp. MIT 14-3879]RDU65080.1 hypothetical protein CQA44_01860 [Helicobacter sp. MIT 14-3879]
MKDWLFPSFAFIIFLYGMSFVIYVYSNYSPNIGIFSHSTKDVKYNDISSFLRDVSESFK